MEWQKEGRLGLLVWLLHFGVIRNMGCHSCYILAVSGKNVSI
jgi:hypothetical protein